jgi:hypothetical protein
MSYAPRAGTEAVRSHLREQVHAYPDLTLAELTRQNLRPAHPKLRTGSRGSGAKRV